MGKNEAQKKRRTPQHLKDDFPLNVSLMLLSKCYHQLTFYFKTTTTTIRRQHLQQPLPKSATMRGLNSRR